MILKQKQQIIKKSQASEEGELEKPQMQSYNLDIFYADSDLNLNWRRQSPIVIDEGKTEKSFSLVMHLRSGCP